jgi:DNA-binding phage protein
METLPAEPEIDFEQVARQLLVAIRGHRSQTAWSRRLGYRSNVAYAWEAGRRWPTAAEALRAAGRTGIDVRGALQRFYASPPAWLTEQDPATSSGVAQLLDDLRGSDTITDLSRRAGISRYSLSRWLDGQTEPRLPDFLRVVEAASLRLVDLVAALVDPHAIQAISPLWERMETRRRGAFEHPWTQAILRALELVAYRALPAHREGWVAEQLGISLEEELRCMAFLASTAQIRLVAGRYVPVTLVVDTARMPEANRRLRAHWASVAAQRVEAGHPGQFSYNVFTVSKADFERIREAHLQYFRTMRSIVAESQPGEVVAVANVHLFILGQGHSGG